jgi:hypothetical protein
MFRRNIDQHFQNKITTIISHTFSLKDYRIRCYWNYERQGAKFIDFGINLSLIQYWQKWERNRSQMSSQARCISRLPMNSVLSQVYPFLGAFAKLRKAAVSFIMFVSQYVSLSVLPSARPQGTTRLPLGGFSWNLMDVFRKSFEEI